MAPAEDFKVAAHEGRIVVTHATGHRYEFPIKDSDLDHALVTPNHGASQHVSMFEEEARKLALERLNSTRKTAR